MSGRECESVASDIKAEKGTANSLSSDSAQKNAQESSNWSSAIESSLDVLLESLEEDVLWIWTKQTPDDDLIQLYSTLCMKMLEGMKGSRPNDTRRKVYKVHLVRTLSV